MTSASSSFGAPRTSATAVVGIAAATTIAALGIAGGAGPPDAMGTTVSTSSMTPSSSAGPDTVEQAQLVLINRRRAAHGLHRVSIDSKLSRAASFMATDMAQRDYFSHTDSRGRSPFQRIRLVGYPSNTWRGENLAAGNSDAHATFVQWRSSPGHDAIMIRPQYRSIGIARVHSDTSTYGWYWATDFGS